MKVNEVYHLIIYCLNCIRRDQNSTYKTGLSGNSHQSLFELGIHGMIRYLASVAAPGGGKENWKKEGENIRYSYIRTASNHA
jgi:hypothetical protein